MNDDRHVEKLPSNIEGYDTISQGGLPRGRSTLVSGTSGSAKTIFALQFLVGGVRHAGENAVFVTFEETPADIRRNMLGLGWDIAAWEQEGKWAFVDASPQPSEEPVVVGEYDLGALLARLEHAVKKVGATRVSIDSVGAIFSRFADTSLIRAELFRIASALKQLGVTALLTAERSKEYGDIGRFGVEEFVADNVIILRNVLTDEKRRRTIEILKYRGTTHQKGEYPFTVIPGEGIAVIPLSAVQLAQKSSMQRIATGIAELDKMTSGGFFRDSIILVSGATGCGKTLMVTHFLAGGAQDGERCLLFAFEESREQLVRNALGWGVDYEKMEQDGNLRILARYPESAGLEDHLIWMKKQMDEYKPVRVAVDSLSALERTSTLKGYREFIIGLTAFIKQREAAGIMTSTTPNLLGGASITEAHISTVTDAIILLRYVELFGEMHRCLTVLKMRGSMHDKDIREYTIDENGYNIGKAFTNVTGILSGNVKQHAVAEAERVSDLFKDA